MVFFFCGSCNRAQVDNGPQGTLYKLKPPVRRKVSQSVRQADRHLCCRTHLAHTHTQTCTSCTQKESRKQQQQKGKDGSWKDKPNMALCIKLWCLLLLLPQPLPPCPRSCPPFVILASASALAMALASNRARRPRCLAASSPCGFLLLSAALAAFGNFLLAFGLRLG